ncbi:MAG: EcsC family protein [Longimonas sp.]|uniref:EcsC family protein n=1 Tax=Longimonas sp. TaxID=2039626 RepID=UPI003353C96D
MADASKMTKALHTAYDLALSGKGPVRSVPQLSADYNGYTDSTDGDVKAFLRNQDLKAGTTGFLSGCGGLITLPVALPAGMASALLIQLRAVATIAHLYGHNPQHDAVRTMCFVCLTGSKSADLFKQAGIRAGQRIAKSALKQLPGSVLTRINQQVGTRLITKFGTTGAINLHKWIPLVGGVVCGAWDSWTTHAVGTVAKRRFRTAAA